MVARIRRRRYTPAMLRIGLGCALLSAVGLVELGTTSGADSSFVAGNAQAQSQAISLAPTTGGLSYAITLATSISDYQDVEAQSLSQTIDLGAIGTSLEAEGCNNSPPTLPQSDVPPPEQAESTNGNQDLTDSITPQSIGHRARRGQRDGHRHHAAGVGIDDHRGRRRAPGQPDHHRHDDDERARLGRQWRHPDRLGHGRRRSALAGQRSGRPGRPALGRRGAVRRGDPDDRDLLHRLADRGRSAGRPLGADVSPQSELDVINTALSPLGFNIVWPVQSTLPDGTVEISPMQIGIDNNALGQELIGANLGSVQAEREAVVNAILNADCNLASEITVGDIGTGVAAGGGNMNILLGGATALTNDQAGSSPFGPSGAPSASVPALGSTGNSGSGGVGRAEHGQLGGRLRALERVAHRVSARRIGVARSAPSSGSPPTKQALGPVQKTADCFSLGPAGGGCYTGNVAVPIGLGVIAMLSALFTWDYVRQRRRGPLHAVTEVTQ